MTCTFFGHRDTPSDVLPYIEEILSFLIENENVETFYVGNNGNFDRYVIKALRKIKEKYPEITYSIVLAYMPTSKNEYDSTETVYPEELAFVPKKFAISKRNDWMINKSDYVVTYIKYGFGGAKQFADKARRKNKTVIDIFDFMNSQND